jgi:3',5'-cyclic AMP phosphodiesterase CpdA
MTKTLHLLLIASFLLTACVPSLTPITIDSAQPSIASANSAETTDLASPIAVATESVFSATPPAKQGTPANQSTGQTKKPKKSSSSASEATALTLDSLNIVLGSVTDRSILISLYSPSSGQALIAYGTDPANLANLTKPILLLVLVPQVIELTDLQPNTAYFYQVQVNGVPGETHSFHTQRAAGASFTFTIEADPHFQDPRFDGGVYAHSLANALANQPDLHINLGDTFMTEKGQPKTKEDVTQTISGMRPYFGVLAADTPLFLVNGNHEAELGWLTNSPQKDIALWSVAARQQYYPNPQPGSFYTGSGSIDPLLAAKRDGYYAFTWGDALFVILDPFWYTTKKPQANDPQSNWNWTLGEEQYNWLSGTLQASEARYKFVFIHHLVGGAADARGGVEFANLYEWGGQNADGTSGFAEHRPGWQMPIHDLLVQNQVSAVFHGHDHVYIQQELDGVVYQEVPQPSIAENGKGSLASEYGYLSGKSAGGAGILMVTISPETALVQYLLTEPTTGYGSGQPAPKVAAQYNIQSALIK